MLMFAGCLAMAGDHPNIVIILADDLGYGDPQCYNSQRGKIPTPNMDRLAAQGMRFTDAHSSSGVCSPSRYTLLTGRYHWRSRLQDGIVGVMEQPLIESNRLTIAGLAKQNGYATACIGKWHLGMGWDFGANARPDFLKVSCPKKNNDEATIIPSAEQLALWKDVFSKPIKGGPLTAGFDRYFGTDVPNWPPFCFIENDRTIGVPAAFLRRDQLKGEPHMASVQGPALKDWNLFEILPTLGRKASAYIEEQAKAKQPFLLYLPLTAPHEPIAIIDRWKGKSGLHPYADYVMETDDVIGSVLDAIEKSGVADNTLVLFTSDNGKWQGSGAAELEKKGHYSSGPLRGYKGEVLEGGHRMPFIVRWPGHVAAKFSCDKLVHQADVMATLADILGVTLPPEAGVDSFSILPLLKGSDKPVRTHAVSCAGSGVPGFRSGEWKLIYRGDGQLYNLAQDIGETNNLAGKEPERVKTMKAQFEEIIVNGRSTPGSKQANDVEVWRYPREMKAKKKGKKD
jgi:arylsulfatase A-like enzyme